MNLIFILFISIFLFHYTAVEAGEEIDIFTHYTTENGLSSDYVHDIAEDGKGFIWITTHYGLNRFDGTFFKTFYTNDYPSLFRNDLYHTFLMPDNKMAFAGSNGVLITYNDCKDFFEDLSPKDFQTSYMKGITGFSQLGKSSLFISTSSGIYKYDDKHKYFLSAFPALSGQHILELWKDSFGRYWAGSFNGVSIINEQGDLLSEYQFMSNLGELINNIIPFDDHHVFLCSTVGSLWLVELDKYGNILPPKKLDTPFKNVSEVLRDSKGRFWFGSLGNGIWRMSFENGLFRYKKVIPYTTNGDIINNVTSLFEDSHGNIWIGTQNSGIWCHFSSQNFCSLDLGIPKTRGTSFEEDKDGNILFGTDGNGFYQLSPDYKIKRHISDKEGLPCNNVLSIKKKENDFILSFWGNDLSQFDIQSGKTKKLSRENTSNSMTKTKYILPTADGDLWACTAGNGVYRESNGKWKQISLNNDSSMKKYPDVWINHLCQSRQGTIWIITARTVWRGSQNMFRSVFPDIDNTISKNPLTMHEGACDSAGNFFVATNNGILRFKADGSSYEWLTFIPKGEYVSILPDKNNQFWISGSNGLSSFIYDKKVYRTHLSNNSIKNSNYFVERASFQDSKGKLYFGCIEGFFLFDPNWTKEEDSITYFAFADLYIQNQKIIPESDFLHEPLSKTRSLELPYDHTNMTITFDVIDFSRQSTIKTAYRIVELDSIWIDLGLSREVKIPHLPVGNYTLEVKAEKQDTELNVSQISLQITVLPPWWHSWWFRTLIVILLVSIATLLFYVRFQNIIRQRERLQTIITQCTGELDQANKKLTKQKQEIELRNEELVHAMKNKDQLISVVAHDLKNPMFAIVGALDDMLHRTNSEETKEKMLHNIYHSATNLQTEMVKLLNWAADTQTNVDCQPNDTDLRELFQEVISLLQGIADEKQVSVIEEIHLTRYAYVDARMISTVLRNILTNAIKFTPRMKKIVVCMTETDDEICLCVKDTGIGMTTEQIKTLLSSDKIISQPGTDNEEGIGLGFRITKDFIERNGGKLRIESEVGKGTSVFIHLPISDQLLKPQQKKTEKTLTEKIGSNKDLLIGKSILIVDDDPLILLHLRNCLEPYVQVLEAKNGAESVNLAKSKIPDLIVSDVEMPVMDGIEMSKILKNNNHTSNIPLLFLSANNQTDIRLSGLSIGAIDYISKPFDEKELILKICNILVWQCNQQVQILMNVYNNNQEPNDNINPLLKQLLEVIRNNYCNPDFSFDDIAKSLNMSKSTLSRRLKSLTNKTSVEILSEYRLNIARQLLNETDRTISEIAYKVGFNDPLYFSRKYKETFGVAPSKRK